MRIPIKNTTPKPALQAPVERSPAWRAYVIIFCVLAVSLLGVWITKELLTEKVCFQSGSIQSGSKTSACVYVEVAQTQAELEKGLGGHRPLGRQEGMLFIFPIRKTYNFWMKDVSFPIDIVWIDGETIVDYQEYAQPCLDGLCSTYSANVNATRVVELPAGFLHRAGIEKQDLVLES
ncbi:DUF192 domain-containing protein [Candidatus Woesearchaeota archaeon]|nr:DUF192 domain-containing protein [Candidatus Woesearchaeota archaeon]